MCLYILNHTFTETKVDVEIRPGLISSKLNIRRYMTHSKTVLCPLLILFRQHYKHHNPLFYILHFNCYLFVFCCCKFTIMTMFRFKIKYTYILPCIRSHVYSSLDTIVSVYTYTTWLNFYLKNAKTNMTGFDLIYIQY